MDGEVIKSFLVGLGFGVDEASLSKFNNSIKSASIRVTTMAGAIAAAATGIFYGVAKLSEGFEQMGYEMRLISPTINKVLVLRQALLSAYKNAGVDIYKVVQQSVLFNMSLAKTKFALQAIYASVGAKFFPLLTKQMDIFRAKIFSNMPKIQATLKRFIELVFSAFEIVARFGERLWSVLTRVWDFFKKLDEATNGWSTKILAAVAAWELLNLAFIATPLGALITGIIALLALYDDFKTYQEGGNSFFNWKELEPAINAAIATFKAFGTVIMDVFHYLGDLFGAIKALFNSDFSGFFDKIKLMAGDALKVIKDFGGYLMSMAQFIGNAFGSADALVNGNGTILSPQGAAAIGRPLGVGGNTSNQSNQNVNMNTNINVHGAGDPHAVGKSVAGYQTGVAAGVQRNMGSNTQ